MDKKIISKYSLYFRKEIIKKIALNQIGHVHFKMRTFVRSRTKYQPTLRYGCIVL